ncbi:hypothetical protein [Streptantibioticus silvisoli]|uniref:LytR family transcriptional regulator n=1 Tax=Streptantibioticus silvisoli TaxID=2705255 RepID=A0ABT6W388_9ACTN|nr:hypothetical protein [Streptantibioticus silvisoli]MDI5965213.1 hypothetical protein [Streptantibioticus silvisoli]
MPDIDPADQGVPDAVLRRWKRRPARPGAARRGRPGPLVWGAGALGFVLAAGGVGGFLVHRGPDRAPHTVRAATGAGRAAVATGPLNILLIGTDSRIGPGRRYGDTSHHPDTAVLAHVAPGWGGATAMSILRGPST